MKETRIGQLLDDLKAGKLSRRSFILNAAAAGISTAAAGAMVTRAGAQDATPGASPVASPAATPVAYSGPSGTLSVARDEFYKALNEKFQFTKAEKTGGTLIQMQTSDLTTLNPLLSSDTYSTQIIQLYNDTLVQTSPIDGTYVPSLADSWELADDGVTYTFHLHEGVKWSDGEPFTADDVIFSFDATVDEKSLSPRRADVISVLKSYRKVDDLTVELVAKRPSATFFKKTVGEVGVAAKHIWSSVAFEQWGSDAGSTGTDAKRVVGTGAFVFKEWVQNDHVTLEKNPNYWNAANAPVYIDEFIYRVVADANSALQSFTAGEADIYQQVSAVQANQLKASNPEIVQQVYDTFQFSFYAQNQDPAKSKLFTDVATRQALHYALDRDLIASQVYQGFAIRADGTEPVVSPAYAPDKMRTIYKLDVDKAKQLLQQAGWADSDGDGIVERDGVKFSFEAEYPNSGGVYTQLLPYMQQAWKEIGVEMIPTSIPFPTLVDHVTSNNYIMSVLGFSWDPDPDQGTMFRTDAKPPSGFNLTGYSNPKYDELSDQQDAELDVAKRIATIIEQTNIVNDDMATGVTVFQKGIAGNQPRVHNFVANAYVFGGVWSYAFVWLDN